MEEARMVSSTLGAILHPQPAPWLYSVSRMGSACGGVSLDVMAWILDRNRNRIGIGWRALKMATQTNAPSAPCQCPGRHADQPGAGTCTIVYKEVGFRLDY